MNIAQTVLLIDDDQDTLDLLTVICQAEGYKVITLQDPIDLPDLVPNLPQIDLVVTDLWMPYVSGFEVYTFLRARPAFKDVPIAVCSAHSYQMEAIQVAGFSGFIIKPISVSRFSEQIKALLAGETVWDTSP